MASTFSTNLALELIGTGDQAGTWGITTNTNLGTLIEQAISGYVTQAVATGTDTTITIPDGATGVARNMYIELTGTGGASTNLIVPANKKLYFIFNNTTGAVTVKVSGQTGVSVPQGKKMVLVSNGTDIVNAANYVADFGSNSATITQLTSTSATITNLTLTSLVLSNLSIASANVTTLTSASATITNLLATSLTVSGNTFLATSSGNVGIGTSSPAYKLDVNASALAVAAAVTNGQFLLREFGGSSANNIIELNVRPSSGKSGYLTFTENAVADRWSLGIANGNSSLRFISGTPTTGTERMTLDSSGNLGLGITPSAGGASGYKLFEIGNAGGGSLYAGPGQTLLCTNVQWDVGTAKYKASSINAMMYSQESGQHIWKTAGTGTAGNTISFTQAMTLDASGNLQVNTGNIYTAATSGIFFSGAIGSFTNGIYGTGSNNVAISANGSERARITSGGDLLLGTTTASGKLTVSGTGWAHFVSNAASSSPSATDPFGIWLGSNRSNGDTEGNIAYRNYLTIASWDGTTYSERARITSGGDFDVGTTANDGWKIHASATADQIRWSYDRNSYSAIFGFATHRGDSGGVEIGNINSSSDRSICFSNGTSYAGRTERARITSGGDFFVNATALGDNKNYFAFSPGNAVGEFAHENGVASGIAYVNFRYNGTTIGSITQNGTTAVAYNTTSDRRLKKDIFPAPSAGEKIDAIEIVSHGWKSAPDEHVEYGVIAQDLALVAPQAVTAGNDGDEIEKPWGVDYSKLVPMLVKEIQSLRARVAALEAK